jgi:hypothetical protein
MHPRSKIRPPINGLKKSPFLHDERATLAGINLAVGKKDGGSLRPRVVRAGIVGGQWRPKQHSGGATKWSGLGMWVACAWENW